MLTPYQQQVRDRFLAAPVMPTPPPWQPVLEIPVGGLQGIGFALDPISGNDLVLTVSPDGRGLFDAVTGQKLTRDRNPDHSTPDHDLTCPGLGPVAGQRVRIAGLFGGGLHTTTPDGWTATVVSPDWPHHRVVLADDGGLHQGPPGEHWWHIFYANDSELRAAGFSPSGQTLAVATSSDLKLWTHAETDQGG